MSKGNITNTTNQTVTEVNQKNAQTIPNQSSQPPQQQQKVGYQLQTNIPTTQVTTTHMSKLASQQISPAQSYNGNNGLFTPPSMNQIQNQNSPLSQQYSQNQQFNQKKLNPYQLQAQQKRSLAQQHQDEEEKTIAPLQNSQHPQKPFYSYETGPLDINCATNVIHKSKQYPPQQIQQQPSHKPTSSIGSQLQQQKQQENRLEAGEKILNKRHQMRMTSGDQKASKRATPHNVTRSLIDDGSEDFTNIEERLQEDTRVSCRNAVASSLHNVSILLKQGQQNLRNRRGTNYSNISGPSSQISKEDAFESSSFFDEGVTSKNLIQNSPHKCNQVEGYNLPTIFNTLMFGIDQTKVSDKVRESFSKMNQARPQSRISGQKQTSQQVTPQQTAKNDNKNQVLTKKQVSQKGKEEAKAVVQQNQIKKNTNTTSKDKLSQLVTKVEKNPILVFDPSQKSNQNRGDKNGSKLQVRASEPQKDNRSHSNSPKNNGRQSQLQLITQQNLKIEQQIEAPDSLHTEIIEKRQIDSDRNHNYNDENDGDEEVDPDLVAQNAANQIEDFQSSELHRNHLIQTLQSLQYIKTLPPANKSEILSRTVRLPQYRHSSIKKTIIFDLDETLVHCIDDIENNPCDHIINVTFPNGETVQAGINVRPYAIECLQKANENYQVVVFTASHKAYADVVLDYLDPEGSLIQYRLYRDHCIRTEEGIYIKDLSIIKNRQLKDLIIVDNAVYSFGYQLDNGIPIIPFYDDKSDEELKHLIFYFNCLAQCEDVREQNRKAFQLKDLQEIDIAEYLQSMMNQSSNQNQDEDDQTL